MEQPLRNLFIDFDAWFASIEQAHDPRLKGQPVAIVPVMTDKTCCIATSYEAKRMGIKTGTSVWDAKKICPQLQLVLSNTARYVHYHHAMLEAINHCIPIQEVLSIDEMSCELTGHWRASDVAINIAQQIKHAVSQVLDVTCSIGIAPNRFLAKMASKLNKPNGLQVLQAEQLPEAFANIGLSDLTGIGRNRLKHLATFGITDIAALYRLNRRQMHSVWGGIEGERLFDELRGFKVYRPPSQRGSVGHSHVLPPHNRQPDKALAIMKKMLQKAAFRLRELGYYARGMRINIRLSKCTTTHQYRHWDKHIQFAPLHNTQDFIPVLNTLWQQRPTSEPIVAIGVQLFALLPNEAMSGDLFSGQNTSCNLSSKVKPVQNSSEIADQINKKYGPQAVFFGGAKKGLDGAPVRIAFTQIPDLELESDQPFQTLSE